MSTTSWQGRAARGLHHLPSPVRRSLWRARRAYLRSRRRALERRGDYSASRPAAFDIDTRLNEIIGKREGFFVEAGAYDGYYQSNTYFLERARGWRGLLIEPVPFLAAEARRERPAATVFNCGLVAPDFGADRLELNYGGPMTTVADDSAAQEWAGRAHSVVLDEPPHRFTVPVRTLSSILDEIGSPAIDVLSLDVEGYEPAVLAGLDLERHAPRYIVAEVDQRSARRDIEQVLGGRYTVAAELSPTDVLYEHVDA